MLVRKQIHKLLSSYYNQPHNSVVGSIPSQGYENDAINFRSILGEWHWRRIYRGMYKNQSGQWLTPVELFRPYYSRVMANFIAMEVDKVKNNTNRKDEKLEIVELGGGRGTNCLCILDHLQNQHPKIYENLDSYTIMDSSRPLLNLMRRVLIEESSMDGIDKEQLYNSDRHRDKVKLKEIDMMDVAERRSDILTASNKNTFVFAMELLDNLPHDKITSCEKTGDILQGEIIKVAEESGTEPTLKEDFLPLKDTLLREILSKQPKYLSTKISQYGCEWIPSVACGVVERIIKARPNASVIFADFDWLPEPEIEPKTVRIRKSLQGSFDPIITCMNDVDHVCYLTAPPLCDILFPTNFPLLAGYSQKLLNDNNNNALVNVMKQSDFLSIYGKEEIENTRGILTGYSPMLEDFTNCSIMTISRSNHQKKTTG